MIKKYTYFIKENTALQDIEKIGIYNKSGDQIYEMTLGKLDQIKNQGNKLYAFGAISDVHLQYSTAQTDFQRALTFFNDTEGVAFTCIAGDLTSGGTDSELAQYKNYVETYSPNTPVYAITGNHEAYRGSDLPDIIEQYTGYPLYYSFIS